MRLSSPAPPSWRRMAVHMVQRKGTKGLWMVLAEKLWMVMDDYGWLRCKSELWTE